MALFILVAAVGRSQCNNSLTTSYTSTNQQDGIMFTISAYKNIVIDSFYNNFTAGTLSEVRIYYRYGLAAGYLNLPGAWTLAGTAYNVVSAGINNPTPIPINVNIPLKKFETVSVYITNTGGSNPDCRTSGGTGVCDTLRTNSDIVVYEGYSKVYPFGTTLSPRRFSGTVFYHCLPDSNYTIIGTKTFCNITVGQQQTYRIDPPLDVDGIVWDLPNGMEFVGDSTNDTVTIEFTNTAPNGLICASVVGCDTVGKICDTIYANPPNSDAGNDTAVCFTQTQLNGNRAKGFWRLISGSGSFADSTRYNTAVSGLSIGSNIFEWVVTGYGCDTHTDQVNITVYPQPVAEFDFSEVCLGQATIFTDQSYMIGGGSISAWGWDVQNDGNNDYITKNASFIYSSHGTKQVTHTVWSNQGCIDSVTKAVEVYPLPNAKFSFQPRCEGVPVGFQDLTTIPYGSITNWLWKFGDNTPNSTQQNPTHTYAKDGLYIVTLTAYSGQGCEDSFTDTVEVFPEAVPNFTAPYVCKYDEVVFTDKSTYASGDNIVLWRWDYDDGSAFEYAQNTKHKYPSPGLYEVELLVITNHGCTSSVEKPVHVYPVPVANFNWDGTCENQTIYFNDASAVDSLFDSKLKSWRWNLGDGKVSTRQNTFNLYQEAGPKLITLTVKSNYGCEAVEEKEILVRPKPQAKMLILDDEVCAGNTIHFRDESYFDYTYDTTGVVAWRWEFGNGESSTERHAAHTYKVGGDYEVKLIARTMFGCIDSVKQTAVVHHNPVANYVILNSEGCSPVCATFIDSSYIASGEKLKRMWRLGGGDSVYGITAERCYSIPNGDDSASFPTSLVVTSSHGCRSVYSSPHRIKVFANPIADFELLKTEISELDSVVYFFDESIGASYWKWDFGDSTYSTLRIPDFHVYNRSGTYYPSLYIESPYGCKDSTTRVLRVNPNNTLFVPNSFSPNRDGKNDVFKVYGDNLEYVDIEIYDRWGRMVHSGKDKNAPWNGYVGNDPAPIGVYTYVLRYRHKGGVTQRTSGTFYLIANKTN
ncbi:MAG: hypothetical protein Kow0075_06830 [Salibacteraceae bacterium]